MRLLKQALALDCHFDPLDPKTKFLSLVPTPGEIAPQYQTTVISSDDVAAIAALKGSHEQGAPACSS
jgi:hypothetical protein